MRGKYLHGIHGEGSDGLFDEGWLTITEEVGLNPGVQGKNYNSYRNRPIVRLNHGYGSSGTIPLPQHYDTFAATVANFVFTGQGCDIWVIGNEPNHSQERPNGQLITPQQYAECYLKCRRRIKGMLGHANDQVLVAAVAPWNVESGDWLTYYAQMLAAIGSECDGFDLHAYTHGADPALITSTATMNPPFQDRFYHFPAYHQTLERIPPNLRHLPAYITEMNQGDAWWNQNTGWVQQAYQEINGWNQSHTPQIRAACLYRWRYDKWEIETKQQVQQDFLAAVQRGFLSPPITPMTSPPPPPNLQPNFERAMKFVLRWEGGWADNPADPGGATMKGITLGTYTAWRASQGLPAPSKEMLRNIPDNVVNQIYYQDYWLRSGADKLPWPLALFHFDAAVNSGPGQAGVFLRESGWDPMKYMGLRTVWYTQLRESLWSPFGRAWARRCGDILVEAVK